MSTDPTIFQGGISIEEMSDYLFKATGSLISFFDVSSCITSGPTLP